MKVWLLPCTRPRRLARPRTSPFHGGNAGSNPAGDANKIKGLLSDLQCNPKTDHDEITIKLKFVRVCLPLPRVSSPPRKPHPGGQLTGLEISHSTGGNARRFDAARDVDGDHFPFDRQPEQMIQNVEFFRDRASRNLRRPLSDVALHVGAPDCGELHRADGETFDDDVPCEKCAKPK